MTETKITSRLKEMDFMRPIVIILLVMMHSFTIYAGGWPCPFGIDCNMIPAYKWIQVITYGCMLEAFTFISGYIFGLQLQKKPVGFFVLLGQKAKRLLIPSVLFGILYFVLLDKYSDSGWGVNALYSIIC